MSRPCSGAVAFALGAGAGDHQVMDLGHGLGAHEPVGLGVRRRQGGPGRAGEETRAAILRVLEVPMTTTEIAARLGVTRGAVSQQLAQLRRAGVVAAHRSGRGVYSSLTALGTRLLALLDE